VKQHDEKSAATGMANINSGRHKQISIGGSADEISWRNIEIAKNNGGAKSSASTTA